MDEEDDSVDSEPVALALGCTVMVEVMELVVMVRVAGLPVAVAWQDRYMSISVISTPYTINKRAY